MKLQTALAWPYDITKIYIKVSLLASVLPTHKNRPEEAVSHFVPILIQIMFFFCHLRKRTRSRAQTNTLWSWLLGSASGIFVASKKATMTLQIVVYNIIIKIVYIFALHWTQIMQ